jgi:Mor family transcriptional regulator
MSNGPTDILVQVDIIELPDDALPELGKLSGDLRLLAELVGVGMALRIAQSFGGTPIRIYGVGKWLRRHRDRCIRRDSDNGVSAVDLGRKYKLSERHIWNILGTAEPDERQMRMW